MKFARSPAPASNGSAVTRARNSGLKRKLATWKSPSVTSFSASRWRAGSTGVKLARGLPAKSRTYTTPPTYFAATCAASEYCVKPEATLR